MKVLKKISAVLLAGALMFGSTGFLNNNDSDTDSNTVSAASRCNHVSSSIQETFQTSYKVRVNGRMQIHQIYRKYTYCVKCRTTLWEQYVDYVTYY